MSSDVPHDFSCIIYQNYLETEMVTTAFMLRKRKKNAPFKHVYQNVNACSEPLAIKPFVY